MPDYRLGLSRHFAWFAALAALWVFALPGPAVSAGHKAHGAAAPNHEAPKYGITVVRAWARASAGRARNGAAYFTIFNKGTRPDRLIGAETPIAKKAQIHEHRMSDGVMRMRRAKAGLAIPPGGTLGFAPRGRHVMLMGLEKPLKAGGAFPLTLVFERAGRITVTISVHPLGGASKPLHQHK